MVANGTSTYSRPHATSANKQWATLTPTIALTAIATLVVLVRLFTRWRIVHGLGFDDEVITFSLFLSWAVCALTVAEVKSGIGGYVWTSQLDLRSYNAKLVLAWNCMYILLVNVTKASVLMQYLRIFLNRNMRILIFTLMSCLLVASCWGLFGGVFLCSPISKLWKPRVAGHCMGLRVYWLSTASVNIVLDFATVLLPIPAICRLKIPVRQRAMLIFLFLLGFFVCGVSLARVALVHNATSKHDYTDASTNAFAWSTIEANTGIICASFLALKPLFVKLFPRFMSEGGTAKHSTALTIVPPTCDDVEKGGVESGTIRTHSYGGSTLIPSCSRDNTISRIDSNGTDSIDWCGKRSSTWQDYQRRKSSVWLDKMDEVEAIEDAYVRGLETQQDTIASLEEAHVGSSNTEDLHTMEATAMIDNVRTEVNEAWEIEVGSSGERRTHS